MNIMVAGALGREFRARTEVAYREALRRHEFEIAERQRRERRDDLAQDDAESLDFAITMISVTEASEFRAELGVYDTATVAALQENEQALALVQARMDKLLAKAYVLPDGRRVFKTEDGSHVFDERGTELGPHEIDPAMIDDARPTWEIYRPELEAKNRLIEERRDLLDYQSKLDQARARLDAGDLTREEFDNLRDELKADIPEAVRDQLPKAELDEHATADADAASAELDISDDMVASSSAQKIQLPGFNG